MEHDDLRYPIGQFARPGSITPGLVKNWLRKIAELPADLRAVVGPMSTEQLETPYRPGGWCVRQVVHHIADSHTNSFVRFKWALTEERPTIKAYHEDRWAELPDYVDVPVETSLAFIAVLHERWVLLLRGLGAEELAREFVHPETGTVRLDTNIGIYAWHGRHHLAHITRLIERKGWVF